LREAFRDDEISEVVFASGYGTLPSSATRFDNAVMLRKPSSLGQGLEFGDRQRLPG
jgi:hypothetical protein